MCAALTARAWPWHPHPGGAPQAGGEEVLRFLAFNTTLTSLDLGDNGLGNPAAIKLFKALTWNITLTSLSLRGNGIKCSAGKVRGGLFGAGLTLRSTCGQECVSRGWGRLLPSVAQSSTRTFGIWGGGETPQ